MSAVRRVAIVGRDAELWLSAMALHRALTPAGVTVEVIELPSQLSSHDCYSAAPSLSGLHDLLSIERQDVLRVSRGLPVTGQRFAGWGEAAFTYGYDSKRAAINNVDILQHWVKARGEGLTLPLDRLSVAAVAAGLGRVGPDGQSPAEFGTVHRGYHLDGRSYAGALRILAAQRGIAAHASTAIVVERTGDRIHHLRLNEGGEVAADLFIDASGADAVLASGQSGDAWQSWADVLPADRLALSSAPPLSPLPAFADIRAAPVGWVGLFPLASRTAIMAAYSSAEIGKRDIGELIAGIARTDRLAPPEIRELAPGARSAWTGNVVAIGNSAASFPPLDLMQLHMAHVGITNLIALFPADRDTVPEAETYNAIVGRYAGNVRDVIAAHYRLNARIGEPLWDRVRATCGSPNFEARLALFEARGLVPLFDEDSFDEGLWSNLLVGHGLIPRGHDPKADRTTRDELSNGLQRMIDLVDQKARAMPTVAAYLGR
jgi:tryptophan halogenase